MWRKLIQIVLTLVYVVYCESIMAFVNIRRFYLIFKWKRRPEQERNTLLFGAYRKQLRHQFIRAYLPIGRTKPVYQDSLGWSTETNEHVCMRKKGIRRNLTNEVLLQLKIPNLT